MIQVVRSARELGPLVPEWQRLVAEASEPNPFYEPFMLVPAVAELARGGEVVTLFVRSDGGDLIGVFPLRHVRFCPAMPAPHYAMWKHPYCYLSTPLTRSGDEVPALRAAMGWLSGAALRLGPHPVGGAFDLALQAFVASDGMLLQTTLQYDRPMVQTTLGSTEYYERAVSERKRKQLRRLQRRLGQRGSLGFHTMRSSAEVESGIGQFIALEHKGWKGRERTSFASNPRDRVFLERAAAAGAARGQVEVRSLTLDAAPIAMSITLRGGGGAFAFKIAYDEDHGANSPGVLLDVEMFKELLDDPAVLFVDGCSDPDYPISNPHWAERRSIRIGILARDSWLGHTLIASGTHVQEWARGAKRWTGSLDPTVQARLRRIRRLLRG